MSEKYTPRPNAVLAAQVIKVFKENDNQWLTSNDISKHITATPAQRWNVISQMSSERFPLLEKREPTAQEKQVKHYRWTGADLDKVIAAPNPSAPRAASTKRTYVRWDEREREMIREAVRLYRKSHPVTMRDAANAVQPMLIAEGRLAPEKRRRLATTAEVAWLFTEPKSAQITVKPPEPPTASVPPPPIPTPPPPVAKPTEPLSTSALVDLMLVKFQQGATKVLADAIDYGMTRAFRNIIDSAQGQKLMAALGEPAAPLPPQRHDPRPTQEARTKLTKLLIAGLRPTEMGEITKEFGDVFDLRFWQPGSSTRLLKSLSKTVDSTLLMVDRMGHSDTELVTDNHVPYKLAKGGPNQLKDLLTQLYVHND